MYSSWKPYVPVAVRRQKAEQTMAKLAKKGLVLEPVRIQGRTIARSFWGKAWCTHLESFSDFSNRLPRGRTYVRNGSVCHMEISQGKVHAKVAGSSLYSVDIVIKPLKPAIWEQIKQRCTGKIDSLLDLLGGRLSDGVMAVVTDRDKGMFPHPRDISLNCSCPDYATMCKHVAAVLYGVAARLDERPELLFLLRGVNHEELVSVGVKEAVQDVIAGGKIRRIADNDLADVFGIDLDDVSSQAPAREPARMPARMPAREPEQGRSRPGIGTAEGKDSGSGTGKTSGSGVERKTATGTGSKAGSRKARPFPDRVTGKFIQDLRARLGLSIKDFASLLDVSPAIIGVWEGRMGTINPQRRSRAALEKVWNEAASSGGS